MYYKLIRDMPDDKAVHGKLYRTSHYINKRTGLLVERLHFICDTLENADYLVPALIYKVQVTQSPKFKRLLPLLSQVPGRSGIRFIGVPSVNQRSVCDGESGADPSTFSQTEFELVYEGHARDDEHSKGCILISASMEQSLTARWLAEQTASDETRLEICNNINYYRNETRI